MQFNFDQVVAHLRKVRTEYGDESFHNSLKGLFRDLVGKPGGEQYIQRLLEEFGAGAIDFESLKAEVKAKAASASPQPSPDIIRRAIEQQMPNCKTQAQFDLAIQAGEAIRVHLNAVYGLDQETAQKALDGLHALLELAPKVTAVQERLQTNPEATTNRDYVDEPRELSEHHKQQTLLVELADVKSMGQLQTWYRNAKPVLDTIVSQKLRDSLFDAIREKKRALTN